MSALRSLLHNAARWLFLAALVYAPWAYGCTTVRTIRGLNAVLTVTLVLAGAGYLLALVRTQTSQLRRRRASTNNEEPLTNNSSGNRLALLVPCAVLLLLGWWMALNARWIYDSDFFVFASRANLIGAAPGSVDFQISIAWMVRATLLLGGGFLVTQLCRDPVWLLRIWWTIALTGGSIALLGLAQKATGAPMIFWENTEQPLGTFFATYYAHGNAGSFLNLVFPFCATLALRGFVRKSS